MRALKNGPWNSMNACFVYLIPVIRSVAYRCDVLLIAASGVRNSVEAWRVRALWDILTSDHGCQNAFWTFNDVSKDV